MTDQPRLRHAMADLAAAVETPAVTTGAAVALAGRIRRRRQAVAATALLSVVLLAAVGLPRPGRAARGIVIRPGPTPTGTAAPGPAPTPTASADPGAAATPGAGGPAAAEPSGPSGASGPTPGASDEPGPTPTGGPAPTGSAPPEPTASPKPTRPPVCGIVVDAEGDTTPVQAPSLDLRVGDFASGETEVAARVRVRSLTAGDVQPQGVTWGFGFDLGTRAYTLTAYRDPGGGVGTRLTSVDDAGGVTTTEAVYAEVDAEAATVTWRVARELVPDLADGHRKFTDFRAFTARGDTGAGGAASAADTAGGGKAYGDRWASCLDAR